MSKSLLAYEQELIGKYRRILKRAGINPELLSNNEYQILLASGNSKPELIIDDSLYLIDSRSDSGLESIPELAPELIRAYRQRNC